MGRNDKLKEPEPKQTRHFTANHVQTSLISHTDSASPVCRPQSRTLEQDLNKMCVFGEWQANVELNFCNWIELSTCGLMTRYMAVCVCGHIKSINMCRTRVCACAFDNFTVLKGSARLVSFNYNTKPSCQHVHTHTATRACRYRWSVCGLPQRHCAVV